MLVFNVIWAKSDSSFLTEWTLFLNIYMFFAWIFICRLHKDYKKVSTKISFSHQFATILMDQNNTLFWWRVASTCILFTAFHLLLLFSSLLWVIFSGSNLLCPLSFLQCMFHHIYSLRNRALGQHKKLCSIVICSNLYEHLSAMWLSTLETGAAQHHSVTGTVPKSLFLFVNRGPIWWTKP